MFGLSQRSIFGPLLLNAYICDLFYNIDNIDFASFADVNTPYSCLSNMISDMISGQLKGAIEKIFDWFAKHFFNGNGDKLPVNHLITRLKTSMEVEVSNTIAINEKRKLNF